MKLIKEYKEIIKQVKTEKPKELTDNYVDSHMAIRPFGQNWGRGVIFKLKNGGLYTSVGSYSISHSILKSRVRLESVKKFYFGFYDGVLYIFDGESKFTNKEILSILDAIVSEGPLKGSLLRRGIV